MPKDTIQIESQGTFIDPQVGLVVNGAGRGSGFIIDPSGIAVTNNHVVTGAALLKVWVGGDPTPHNAKVLGVSECSDLAVIDIDGDGYPYLKWYSGNIDVGMDMYVAGYPLGDPEYSLTKGIISKDKANGETSWASVKSVIEYDATTNVNFDRLLLSLGQRRFVVFGVATEYCVRSTALGLRKRGRAVDLVADAIKDIRPEDGPKAIEEMTAAGVRLVKTAAVCAAAH